MITPQIFALSVVLSIAWGWDLVDAIRDYQALRDTPLRHRGELVTAFKGIVRCLCLFSIVTATLVRTALVLAGFGDVVIGHILFFALVGINLPGALFSILSRRYD